jgi:hypothetical protein
VIHDKRKRITKELAQQFMDNCYQAAGLRVPTWHSVLPTADWSLLVNFVNGVYNDDQSDSSGDNERVIRTGAGLPVHRNRESGWTQRYVQHISSDEDRNRAQGRQQTTTRTTRRRLPDSVQPSEPFNALANVTHALQHTYGPRQPGWSDRVLNEFNRPTGTVREFTGTAHRLVDEDPTNRPRPSWEGAPRRRWND